MIYHVRFFVLFILSAVSFSVYSQQWSRTYVPHVRSVNQVVIRNPQDIQVVGGNFFNDSIESIFRTVNQGISWDFIADYPTLSWLKSVAYCDSLTAVAVGSNGKIKRTTDGGLTWAYGSSPVNCDFSKIIFVNSQMGFIVGARLSDTMQFVLKTTNSGQSFSVIYSGHGPQLNSLYFSDALNGFAVGDAGTILHTSDGGNNWNPILSPLNRTWNCLTFITADTGFVAGGIRGSSSTRSMLKTTDGGANWSVIKDETGGILTDIFFLNRAKGYVVGDSATFMKTVNGGSTWVKETIPNTISNQYFSSVTFYNDSLGAIGAWFGSVYLYTYTPLPEVYTTGSNMLDSASARLYGSVNTHGYPAQYYFFYSTDSSMASPSWSSFYGTDVWSNTPTPVQSDISNLAPNTWYYYCVRVVSNAGEIHGDTLKFFSGSALQTLNTLPATAITTTSATLNGFISGFQNVINLSFECGTTPAFGNSITASPSTVSDTALHYLTANVLPLQPYTYYYFRLKGQNGNMIIYGNTNVFFTGNGIGIVQTNTATAVTDSTAILNGLVSGFHVPVSLTFEYSINIPSYNLSITPFPSSITDSLTHTVNSMLTSLVPNTTYYYRLKAHTVMGDFYGAGSQFYTGVIPIANILPVKNISWGQATFSGYASPGTSSADVYFEYGLNGSFSDSVQANPFTVSGSQPVYVSANLTSLTPDQKYSVRLRVNKPSGSFYSDPLTFYPRASEIPNGNFESWERITKKFPTQWSYIGNCTNTLSYNSTNALFLYGDNKFPAGIALTGAIIPGANLPTGGTPFTARPDSMFAYINYDIAVGDTALVFIILKKNGTNISEAPNGLTGNSGGAFVRTAFPISYTSSAFPDTIIVGFLSTKITEGPQATNPESWMKIDDISFSGTNQNVPNHDFEAWDSLVFEQSTDWAYAIEEGPSNLFPYIPYYKSTDAVSGQYAIHFENIAAPYNMAAYIRSRGVNNNGTFPLSHRYSVLNGYYKFIPAGTDTLAIRVEMLKNGAYIGNGGMNQSDTVNGYTLFSIPIYYQDSVTVPDSFAIYIRGVNSDTVTGNSVVYIDNLGFDGFYLDSVTVSVPADEADKNTYGEMHLFPNPANSVIFVALKGAMDGDREFKIVDITGKTLKSFKTQNQKLELFQLNIADLASGIYFLSATAGKHLFVSKFVKD